MAKFLIEYEPKRFVYSEVEKKYIELSEITLVEACEMETKSKSGMIPMSKCKVEHLDWMWKAYVARLNNPEKQDEKEMTLKKLAAVNQLLTVKSDAQKKLAMEEGTEK